MLIFPGNILTACLEWGWQHGQDRLRMNEDTRENSQIYLDIYMLINISEYTHTYFSFHINVKTVHTWIKKVHTCISDARTNISLFQISIMEILKYLCFKKMWNFHQKHMIVVTFLYKLGSPFNLCVKLLRLPWLESIHSCFFLNRKSSVANQMSPFFFSQSHEHKWCCQFGNFPEPVTT